MDSEELKEHFVRIWERNDNTGKQQALAADRRTEMEKREGERHDSFSQGQY